MEITPVFKEKTKNKIIYPRINIYYYSIPNLFKNQIYLTKNLKKEGV